MGGEGRGSITIKYTIHNKRTCMTHSFVKLLIFVGFSRQNTTILKVSTFDVELTITTTRTFTPRKKKKRNAHLFTDRQ